MAKGKRERGSIRPRGNSFEVRVYAGLDPLTKTPIYLTGTAPTYPEAEKLRTKFLAQVDENRHPRSNVSFVAVLENYLTTLAAEEHTLYWYGSLIVNYIEPTFKKEKAGKVTVEMLDMFYARLGRCKEQCEGKRAGRVDSSTGKPHKCTPLAPSTIRKLHFFIRPALKAAVRWDYLSVNIADLVELPNNTRKEPDPPSVEEAARVLNAAWRRDPDWATMLWLAMVTGCRRGELCSLQWCDVDLVRRIIWVAFSEQKRKGKKQRRKDTKTHQKRRIALDYETIEILEGLLQRRKDSCAALGLPFRSNGYLFSADPDGADALLLGSVTQRYKRLAIKLGLSSHRLHSLRHYTATELIAAGVDIRTVAGRLGHGSGGATTLRVYAAWSPAADQRAASVVGRQLPHPGRKGARVLSTTVNGQTLSCDCGNRTSWGSVVVSGDQVTAVCGACQSPVAGENAVAVHELDLSVDEAELAPYQLVANAYRTAIADGSLAVGAQLPRVKEIAALHEVSVGTAHRALSLLVSQGLVAVKSGVRATVVARTPAE
ncbi:tyrosine-type recombinase/integrase [Catenulispora pinisilvae]|uniref:tyrosine-type recombinase/integrase n=1 Tax=Catenulispora pinisilvae TaxID=2705253 RepID=UPI001E4F8401|nr:tyrosine-type recombinase/integrase [Catenulispora pinisilvae]